MVSFALFAADSAMRSVAADGFDAHDCGFDQGLIVFGKHTFILCRLPPARGLSVRNETGRSRGERHATWTDLLFPEHSHCAHTCREKFSDLIREPSQEIRAEMALRQIGPIDAALGELMLPERLRQSAAGDHDVEDVLESFRARTLGSSLCETMAAVDIDWDMGTLFVGLTKNGEPLLAPISDAAMERLKTVPRTVGNPHIICGQKPGQHMRGLGDALRRVLKRWGERHFRRRRMACPSC